MEAVLAATGIEGHSAPDAETKQAPAGDADKALLHRPQLPRKANDRATIDRLFSGN
jgi:hypothetical protein